MVAVKPFLKWAGSKRQLVPELLKHVPGSFGSYFEPFLGSGALYFALRPQHAYLSDANARLIQAWKGLRSDATHVIGDLEYMTGRHGKEFYYETRTKTWPENDKDAAARFVYLNKTGFNGLWRVNKAGQMNVPMGRYTNPNICDAANLRACAQVLQTAAIECRDYLTIGPIARAGDLVYFDPPYVPMSATSEFTAYTADGFGPDDQRHLRDLALDLKQRGVHVILSNSATPAVEALYGESFTLHRVSRSGAISSKGDGRGRVAEYIIT